MQVLGDRAIVAAVHKYNPEHCHTNEKDSETLRLKAEQKVKGIFQLQFINYYYNLITIDEKTKINEKIVGFSEDHLNVLFKLANKSYSKDGWTRIYNEFIKADEVENTQHNFDVNINLINSSFIFSLSSSSISNEINNSAIDASSIASHLCM